MPDLLEIKSQFESLGIEVQDEILNQCEVLCSKYLLTEENLVEAWVAWSFNNLNGEGPTRERIIEWENKELSKQKISTPKVNEKIKVYSSSSKEATPKPAPVSKEKTPEGATIYENSNNYGKQQLIFSPASFSPDVYSPSLKYNSRTQSRESVSTFGSTSHWVSHHKSNFEVAEVICTKTSEWKYLHNTLRDKSLIILDACEELADFILTKNELPAPLSFSSRVLDNSVFVGRMNAFDKTKSSKIQLCGLFQASDQMIELDLFGVADYSLFPGQVVAIEGCINSNKLLVNKIYTSAMLPLAPQPKLSDTLQILVAAGPFTLCDTLSYEPLHDLVQYVKEKQPDVLFLIGPLIDANNSKVSEGNIAESFYDYYKRMITNLVDSLRGIQTKLFIIASGREAFGIPVFPTPPSYIDVSFRNVKFYPDPSLLSINGLIIGLTATDSILHIGKYEISNSKCNRLARLAAHMLHQQTFYPLHPCEPGVGLDETLWHSCARLPLTPHILIAPSDLKSFVKDVDGCIIINPERLAKGMVGGTFACIEVRPTADNEDWKTSTHISVNIIKI